MSVKVCFKISYYTQFGQSVALITNSGSEGWNEKDFKRLECKSDEGTWELRTELPYEETTEYKYLIVDDEGTIHRRESESVGGEISYVRKFTPRKMGAKELKDEELIEVWDMWTDGLAGAPFVYASAALHTILKPVAVSPSDIPENHVLLRFDFIYLPPLQSFQTLYISGSNEYFGSWDPKRARPITGRLCPSPRPAFILSRDQFPFEYRIFVTDEKGTVYFKDEQENGVVQKVDPKKEEAQKKAAEKSSTECLRGSILEHIIHAPENPKLIGADLEKETKVLSIQIFPEFDFEWRGAGVSIPVTALRSENGLGVGEFPDLKLLADWAKNCGMHVIQILPVNDSRRDGSFGDAFPYSAMSIWALHPMYVNLNSLEPEEKVLKEIESNKKKLNEGTLKYKEVMSLKMKLLREIFDSKKKLINTPEFEAFVKDNRDWLESHALYYYLRDKFGTPDHRSWPEHSKISEEEVKKLTASDVDYYEELQFSYWVQYHLHCQLTDASLYAKSKGVILKGDLPFGVSSDSVEVWVRPQIFLKNMHIGCPPDDFSDDGQNWGFPSFNQEELKKDDYAWLRNRLNSFKKYFKAFRIDHAVGFFRFWEIPTPNSKAFFGRFNPVIPLTKKQLEEAGVQDWDRLLKPYVREHHFEKNFPGDDHEAIKKQFFDENPPGFFQFKSEFENEMNIRDALPIDPKMSPEESSKIEKRIGGLVHLIANVILLPLPKPDEFTPRLHLSRVDSFNDYEEGPVKEFLLDQDSRNDEINYDLWKDCGMGKFRAMQRASDMLICSEDLGTIPSCCRPVLEERTILEMIIQRSPKSKNTFDKTEEFPWLAVCTPSVHDTSCLREWWEEDYEKTKIYWHENLHRDDDPPKFCEPWIVEEIISMHFKSRSLLSIICIQDLFALTSDLRVKDPKDERINKPGESSDNLFVYRIPFTLEKLLEHKDLPKKIKGMLVDAARG